jgi:SAM-dependent methyltransferase
MIDRLLRYLVRRRHPAVLADLARTAPVSRAFGFDRGTPIDRRYIDAFLRRSREHIQGAVLEVASNELTRRFGGERVTRSEVLHATPGAPGATLVGDLARPESLPEGLFDCFICTQTLHCVFEIREAVRGCHRLLAPGGVLLATLPGISQISRYDMDRWGDYWRVTTAAARRLFEPVFGEHVEVESLGNVLAATMFLQGLTVEDLPDPSLLDRHDPDYQVTVTVVARRKAA